jgi:hypothetical protein
LNHYFWLRCSRADRFRFLRAYLKARASEPPDARAFARGIEGSTRSWAERLWRRWGKRCHGSNKYFRAYRGRGSWAVASRTLDPATVRALMADPDAPFQDPEAHTLKDSRTTTVAAVSMLVNGKPTPVVYKRFNRRAWFEPLLCIFRPSRAWRAWQGGQHLSSRGVPTPANLLIVGRAWLPYGRWLTEALPREMYLVTRRVEPALTLREYVFKVLPALDGRARRISVLRLTRALARLIRTMHERSLSHRDLKAANILIHGDPGAEEPELSLIDLVGVQLAHPLPWNRRVQNLARLQVSLSRAPGHTRTDSLRFLHAYLPWSLSPRHDWKTLWRAVARRSRQKEAQNRRSGRRLS